MTKFNIKNPLYKIFLFFIIVFIPIAIIFLDLNSLIKKNKKNDDFIKFFLFFLFMFYVYIIGSDNISGEGAPLIIAIYLLFVRFLWIKYIGTSNPYLRKIRIAVFTKIVLIYVVLSFVSTYFFNNQFVEERTLQMLFYSGFENSTNYINIIIMGLTVLLLLNEKMFLFILIIVSFLISIIWQNRTGIIILPSISIVYFLRNKQYKSSVFLVIIGVLNYSIVINDDSRIGKLGVESERSLIALDAVNSLSNYEYPFGGYKVNSLEYNTYWVHNMFLDTYRLVGIPGMIILLLLVIYSLVMTFKMEHKRFVRLFCWLVGFSISVSSVALEGTYLEFVFVFLLLFNFYFIDNNEGYVL